MCSIVSSTPPTVNNSPLLEAPKLNLPSVNLKYRMADGILKVFDPLRRKYVALTPEEYVRQHFTAWMRSSLHYPASMMANEIGIEVNGTRKRCDTVVFDRDGAPLIVCEYKAPTVQITQDVFDQAVRYNLVLQARYIIVSNGLQHFCCMVDIEGGTYQFIPQIPDYQILVNPHSDN